jgi:two-component system CheB/CheR fusion protein
MTQVFWNLLQNACKFTPQCGVIDIRVYNEQAQRRSGNGTHTDNAEDACPELVVEISDNGIGISPESMPRIFDAFEQGERSRTRVFGGLGLGLAISRAIVDLHGGSLTATSEGRNKGAKLVIRLTTVSAPAAAGTPQPSKRPGTPASLRPLRVLLVEDHSDTAAQLTRLPHRHLGQQPARGAPAGSRKMPATTNARDSSCRSATSVCRMAPATI